MLKSPGWQREVACPPSARHTRAKKGVLEKKVCSIHRAKFTVVFYGLEIFGCKTVQFCVTRRDCGMAETPSVRDDVQRSGNTRENSFLKLLHYSVVGFTSPNLAPFAPCPNESLN
jgi:hypothetical protein